jgi:hypothetical protein
MHRTVFGAHAGQLLNRPLSGKSSGSLAKNHRTVRCAADMSSVPHYRNRVLCRVSKTLGKGYFTLDKAFAEGNTRQRTLDKYFIGKGFFAEYFFRTLGKDFAECRKALSKEKHLTN